MRGLWPRALQLVLGCWLLLSPLFFRHTGGSALGLVDRGAGMLIVAVVAISLLPSLDRLHLATLPVALVLIAWSWSSFPRPGPAGAQNQILVGLLLGMLSVLPADATSPPESWQRYVAGGEADDDV